jgi:7-cyano-7-deazaguanine synthase
MPKAERRTPNAEDPRRPRAVVLLSGGVDSTVAAAIARAEGFEVHALTVRYGQRHAVELDAARRVASALGLASHRVVDVDLRAIGGSALTADTPVPKTGSPSSPPGPEGTRRPQGRRTPRTPNPGPAGSRRLRRPPRAPIPVTYVPARNTLFLSLALGYAEVLGARDVFLGVSSVDYSGYPDCRPAFIAAFEELARVATRAGVEGAAPRIRAPLLHLSKADTVRRGVELGVDFSPTHSCYDPAPDGAACGSCDSCRLRREAFRAAGVPDPTRYAASPGGPQPAIGDRRPATVRVLEVHRTIQGETTFAGEPCVIVRLAGCPLRCSYCDTAHAREAEGLEMTVPEVVRQVRDLGPGIVAVTGGEPLAQRRAGDLLRALADDGRAVLLETSGAFDASGIDPRVRRIIDVKCPGSGMCDRNLPVNLERLRPIDELKFVLCDRADYEWARDLVRRDDLASRCTVLFSPAHGTIVPADLAAWIVDDRLPVRLQLQLHRVIWPERERGV